MPSKLKFKGEKKKRKRQDVEEEKPEKDNSAPEGWISAQTPDHLKGPVVILNDDAKCLCADLEGKTFYSTELDQTSKAERVADRVEPTSTQQVFVFMPLDLGSTKKYALRTGERYLSLSKDGGGHSAKASAVGAQETFDISRQDDGWVIENSEGRLCVDDKYLLTLRVQAQHAIEAAPVRMKERISTRELEDRVGRKLKSEEVRFLKKAYKSGRFNEALLDVREKTLTDSAC